MNKPCLVALSFLALSTSAFPAQTPPSSVNVSTDSNQIRPRYENLKQEYHQSVNRYREAKNTFTQAKDSYSRLQNAASLKSVGQAGQTHVARTTETIIKHLEILIARIEKSPLTDESKSQLTAEIEADIVWLKEQQTVIEGAETVEDLRPLFASIKEYWGTIRIHTKRVVGHLLAANFERFANHLEELSERLRSFLAESSDQSAAEAIAAADNEIAAALSKYEEAKGKFDSIATLEDSRLLFSEGHQLLKEAKQHLLEAHRLLRQAAQQLKQSIQRPNLQAESASEG